MKFSSSYYQPILKINWAAKNILPNLLILSKDEVYVYPKR